MSEVLYYRIRRAKAGPLVPCKIWFGPPLDPDTGEELDRSPRWQCVCSGTLLEDPFQVILLVDGMAPVVKGERISAEDYEFMTKDAAWCRQYDPEAPEANPRKPVDLNKIRPIF